MEIVSILSVIFHALPLSLRVYFKIERFAACDCLTEVTLKAWLGYLLRFCINLILIRILSHAESITVLLMFVKQFW